MSSRNPRYKRILLKLSGEALMGSEDFGIDPKVLDCMALEVGQLVGIGVEVGLAIGGGEPVPRCRAFRCGYGSRHWRPHGHVGNGHELAGHA
ncbi:Uridylate kinase [Stutzerimonas stutzeri]